MAESRLINPYGVDDVDESPSGPGKWGRVGLHVGIVAVAAVATGGVGASAAVAGESSVATAMKPSKSSVPKVKPDKSLSTWNGGGTRAGGTTGKSFGKGGRGTVTIRVVDGTPPVVQVRAPVVLEAADPELVVLPRVSTDRGKKLVPVGRGEQRTVSAPTNRHREPVRQGTGKGDKPVVRLPGTLQEPRQGQDDDTSVRDIAGKGDHASSKSCTRGETRGGTRCGETEPGTVPEANPDAEITGPGFERVVTEEMTDPDTGHTVTVTIWRNPATGQTMTRTVTTDGEGRELRSVERGVRPLGDGREHVRTETVDHETGRTRIRQGDREVGAPDSPPAVR